MIDYTHPNPRRAAASQAAASARTDQRAGVRLRPGQSISLATAVAQHAADARAQATRAQ